MRLGFVFIPVIWLIMFFPARGQEKAYVFNFNGVSLAEAIDQIESQSKNRFYYAKEWLSGKTVDLSIRENTLENVLDRLFAGTRLNFLILDNKVILTDNTPIITEIYTENPGQKGNPEFMYAREYEVSDRQAKTYVIGKKSDYEKNGRSLVVGYIRDSETGEPIAGAFIQVEGTDFKTITNEEGFYALNMANGNNTITYQYTGYELTTRKAIVFSNGSLNVAMTQEAILLDDVVLFANRDENVSNVQMGISKIDLPTMKNIPKVLGENDVLKVALALPGVQNVGEGAAGLNVRGGNADQNLMLFDHATIYNPFHFFGFFSALSADILGAVEVYKNSIPAHFGGRLSSVFDIRTKNNEKEKFSGTGGISPVTSQLSLNIPLIKGKTSLITGARSMYSDWVLNLVDDKSIRDSDPFFFDWGGSLDHSYGKNNHLRVSGYYSEDRFKITTDSLFSYSNTAASINWRHFFSDKLAAEMTASLSNYDYSVLHEPVPESSFEYGFEIRERYGKLNLNYYPSDKHDLVVGIDSRYYQINPGYKRPSSAMSLITPVELAEEQGLESAFFIGENYRYNDRISVYAGFRYSVFNSLGPADINFYTPGSPRSESNITDIRSFDDREIIETYHGPEIRISMRYALPADASVKLAFNTNRQYIHTLSNTISISPTDTWKLSDPNIKPQFSRQFSAGFFKNFANNTIETSVEFYHKKLKGLIDYRTGAELILNELIEADVLQGDGKAYGAEFLIRKNYGKLTGWLGYTYSRSQQRFDSEFNSDRINNGAFFSTNYEKPHDFSAVTNFKLTNRYSFSLNVNYSTGRPITYPAAKFQLSNVEIIHYTDRNTVRVPNYFRVDFGFNIEASHKIKKLTHGYWSFSVYNLTGRKNVYSIFFANEDGQIKGYKLSVFGAPIPSISYNFKF